MNSIKSKILLLLFISVSLMVLTFTFVTYQYGGPRLITLHKDIQGQTIDIIKIVDRIINLVSSNKGSVRRFMDRNDPGNIKLARLQEFLSSPRRQSLVEFCVLYGNTVLTATDSNVDAGYYTAAEVQSKLGDKTMVIIQTIKHRNNNPGSMLRTFTVFEKNDAGYLVYVIDIENALSNLEDEYYNDKDKSYKINLVTEPGVAEAATATKPVLNLAGKEVFIYYYPLEQLGLYLKMEYPAERLYRPLSKIRDHVFKITGFISLLILFAGVIVSRRITVPLQLLAAESIKIGRGDFHPDLSNSSPDEVGVLTREMNTMALNLRGLYNSVNFEKNKLESIISSIGDGTFITDAAGTITIWNAAMVSMTGYTVNEVIGRNIDEIIAFQYSDRSAVAVGKNIIADCLVKKNIVKSAPMPTIFLVKKDGTGIPVSYTSAPVLGLHDEVAAAVTVLKDITEQIEIDRMKTDFVNYAAHQFKTPIHAINMAVENLMKNDKIRDPKIYYAIIKKRADEIVSRIGKYLSLAVIESKREILKMDKHELVKVVEESIESVRFLAEQKKVSIRSELPDENIELYMNRDKLKEVFENIMNNGIKYNKLGGEIRVAVTHEADEKEVRVIIADTGVGLNPDELEIIKKFDKFQRFEGATEGTGLGLVICKEIVTLHKGSVDIQSVKDQGTTFTVILPLEKRAVSRRKRDQEKS